MMSVCVITDQCYIHEPDLDLTSRPDLDMPWTLRLGIWIQACQYYIEFAITDQCYIDKTDMDLTPRPDLDMTWTLT